MSARRIILGAAVWLVLAIAAGYATRAARRQRMEHAALTARVQALIAEAARLRRDRDATTKDLAHAEQQLASLPPPRAADPDLSSGRQAEIAAWLARVKQLRRLFDERPNQRIPELQFLTDRDWLGVAKNVSFDSEENTRRALAAARDTAIYNFTQRLSEGLRKLAKAPNADPATGILALTGFLAQPVDVAILDRYELAKISSTRLGGRVEWIVQNKAPIDEEFDSRVRISASKTGSYGGSSMPGVIGWIPDFQERMMRAAKDFTAAKKGAAPADIADVVPYFNPPLDPATVEKAMKAMRDRKK